MYTKILLFAMLTVTLLPSEGHALTCFQCFPGPTGTCDEAPKVCEESMKCVSSKYSVVTGAIPVDIPFKTCGADRLCLNSSVNLGFLQIAIHCCFTDLCNKKHYPTYDPTPNGNKCYTCKDDDCCNEMECHGDEDTCLTASGILGSEKISMMKGCLSNKVCITVPGILPGVGQVTSATCCQGDFCNNATGTGFCSTRTPRSSMATSNVVNLLFLVAPMVCVALFN